MVKRKFKKLLVLFMALLMIFISVPNAVTAEVKRVVFPQFYFQLQEETVSVDEVEVDEVLCEEIAVSDRKLKYIELLVR